MQRMKTFSHLRILLGVIMVLSAISSFSQEIPTTGCSSDHKNDSLILHDPRFARSMFLLETAFRQNMTLDAADRTDDVYVLPVVVHIIHEGEPVGQGSNISDAQILSAISALNDDYRRMPGTNGFGNGVDVKMEFCLASRNPQGQPTTGIVRVNGSSVPLYADQGIESTGGAGANEEAVKALSTWPRTDYINIWIVNEIENNDGGSGVQGYAYFPFNNPVDGIVILHNAFGTVGTLKSYTNMNRTLSHEMGHYLGLYHTFHETTSCGAEANCLTSGDRVCDTPVTILSASCSSPACGGTQQVENYMDYTNQSCQDMFSEGQKTRMRTTLETQRESLLSSLGCMPVYARDAGITSISAPSGMSCNTNYTPFVTLTNFGSQTLTSCTISYNVDGVGSNNFAWSGNLTSGSSTNITLPQIIAGMGSHTFYAWSVNPNGLSDENGSNDQGTSSFSVTTGATVSLAVQVDYFGVETTWEVVDENDNQIAYGGPYANNTQGTIYTETLCLPNGCYTLVFHDAYGDGQSFTSGNYALHGPEGELLASASGNWGATSATPFCISSAPMGEAPTASFTVADNIICAGATAAFTYTGTNNPTAFMWSFSGASNGSSSAVSPSGITYNNAGVYNVTLTVSNEFGSDVYTCNNCITVINGPVVNINVLNPSCAGGNNGGLTAVATGGYSPYTYAWSNNNSSNAISNLQAGSYSISVTNAQGCVTNANATLTNPAPLQVSVFHTDATCFGMSDGSAVANSTGGTGSVSYVWSTGSTDSFAANMSAGTYIVTAQDANGCTDTESFLIEQPTMLVANTIVLTPETCAGNDGSASIEIDGGSGEYVIIWASGSESTLADGLSAGNYFVSIADQNGCTLNANVNIPYECSTPTPTTKLIDQDCGATDLALTSVITCDEVDGASMYQWKFTTATGQLIAEDYSIGNQYYLVQASAIQSNSIYLVSVKVMVESTWGPFGQICSIQTEQVFGTPQLSSDDCGTSIVAWGQVITSDFIDGVQGYEWAVSNATSSFNFETTDNQLVLDESLGLMNNTVYTIQVRCNISNGEYTEWSTACEIGVAIGVGIDEFGQGDLTIYPNPSSGDNITLDFGNIASNNIVSDIQIFNSAGSLIENFNQNLVNGSAQRITYEFTHPLASGVYILHYNFNGLPKEKKLIVR